MANVIERLCGEYEWFDDFVELVWWGKAESGVVVGRESESDFLEYYSRYMTDANGIPVSPEFVADSEYPEFEFDLVAHRAPSWLRWWRSKTVHRMKAGEGFA